MSSAERPEFTHVRPLDEASPEEPRTPLRDALSRLEAAVATIHDSDSFRRFLDAQARFHRYSWANTLLILDQRPDADWHPLLGGGAMGYYVPEGRRIVLREAAPRQMAKTLAHELAHHFSGARSSSEHEETVAESVAYVTCARFGLDTGERSFPY